MVLSRCDGKPLLKATDVAEAVADGNPRQEAASSGNDGIDELPTAQRLHREGALLVATRQQAPPIRYLFP